MSRSSHHRSSHKAYSAPPPPMPEAPKTPAFAQQPYRPSEGTAFIRMFVVQGIQSSIINRKKLNTPAKLGILFLIFLALLSYDVNNFFQNRTKNIYEELGILKNATISEVNAACNKVLEGIEKKYNNSLEDEDFVVLAEVQTKSVFKTKDDIDEVRHLLTTLNIRDIYDKTGVFVTRADFQVQQGQFPQHMRYLQAFGNSMSFSIFFILIFFMIDKHQVFAKQLSLSSLLICVYFAVYMKFPKEGDKDNEVAEILNRLPFFQNLTINDMGMLLQMLFSNLFQLILSLSKLIDVHPLEDSKKKYTSFQKKGFRTQLLCELIQPRRQLEVVPPPPQQQLENANEAIANGVMNPDLVTTNGIVEKPEEAILQAPAPEKTKKELFFEAYRYVASKRQDAFPILYFNSLKSIRACLKKLSKRLRTRAVARSA